MKLDHLTALLLLAAVGAFAGLPAQEEKPSRRPEEKSEEKKAREPESPIPELPKDKLPPATAPRPDPAREQYEREPVFVEVSETIQPREGERYRPEIPVLENYLEEYFRRAGFRIADRAESAAYRIEGSFQGTYENSLIFRGRLIALRFKGSAVLEVRNAAGEVIERVEIPEDTIETRIADPEKDGDDKPGSERKDPRREETIAVLDLRRKMAKLLWDHFHYQGKTFKDPEIPSLITSLALDAIEDEEPVLASDVLRKLVARRFEAVPYLIEALSDARPVLIPVVYPGLDPTTAPKLRIYHLADKALEEIFQKVSRMNLDSTSRQRFIIIRGWENEWRRFCKPYRESPQASPPASPRAQRKDS